MTDTPSESGSSAVLDPIDRISEVLFGLFMVLTFTGTLSVVDSGRDEVRDMLVAAIGCNIAWGFVDGVMYVLRNLVARSRKATLMRAVREAAEPAQAHRIISQEIGNVSRVLGAAKLERMRSENHCMFAPLARYVGAKGLARFLDARPEKWWAAAPDFVGAMAAIQPRLALG